MLITMQICLQYHGATQMMVNKGGNLTAVTGKTINRPCLFDQKQKGTDQTADTSV
jgi:hypothetical protein